MTHWLLGNGKEWIIENKEWRVYMTNNSKLKRQVRDYFDKVAKNMKKGVTAKYKESIKVVIENGEGIIGYHYLHGTEKSVGGFYIEGTITTFNDGSYCVSMKYCWNDIIDPNNKYLTDRIKSAIGKVVSLGRAKNYTIRIRWSDTTYIYYSKGRSYGWLS